MQNEFDIEFRNDPISNSTLSCNPCHINSPAVQPSVHLWDFYGGLGSWHFSLHKHPWVLEWNRFQKQFHYTDGNILSTWKYIIFAITYCCLHSFELNLSKLIKIVHLEYKQGHSIANLNDISLGQNNQHFVCNIQIFSCMTIVVFWLKNSPKFVLKGEINKKPALVQTMAKHLPNIKAIWAF